MASPSIANKSASSPGSKPIILKPVITELIRTRHCANPLTILLDRITIVPGSSSPGETENDEDAYRLWLSDGSKMIQAVLMPDLHPFLTAGEVGEGHLLTLTRYALFKARKSRLQGWVWMLVVYDMEVCGFDGRASRHICIEGEGALAEARSDEIQEPDMPGSKLKITPDRKDKLAGQKRRHQSEDEDNYSPAMKRILQDSQRSPSPLKPKTRSILQERAGNSPVRSPSKTGKHNSFEFASQSRNLLWDETDENTGGDLG